MVDESPGAVRHGRGRSAGPADDPDRGLRFSVIVPCYNEVEGILGTIRSLHRHLADAGAYEIIVVDDGSTDESAALVAAESERDPRVRLVAHDRNRGYGASLKTGLRRARAELIAITDADGTYPLDRLPALVTAAESADMVVGARTAADVEYPLIRKLPKAVLTWYASWMANQRIPDLNSGLRVFRRQIAERYLSVLPDGFSFTTTITLAMLTHHYDVRFEPIGYLRRIGRSKIRPIRDTLNFLQLIFRTAVYFAPLRAFTPVLLVLAAVFSASAAYDVFVIRNLTDKTLIFLMLVLNTGLFALLADMIDKRSPP